MSRNIGAVCRLCRREGEKLFLKGEKCNSEKCPVSRRTYAPGEHGQKRSKLSNFGLQLREKQKVKRMYGVLERQFRRYFAIAAKSKGVTGKILIQLLERRLDNVILRLGIATSRNQARQIIRHNFIYVNSRRVNIPSFLVETNNLISVKQNERAQKIIKPNLELAKEKSIPAWLEWDANKNEAKVIRLPEKEDIQQPIQEQLIVELYSK